MTEHERIMEEYHRHDTESGRRIRKLEAALREIATTYDETPQTPSQLSAALYSVSKLASHALRK